MLCATMRPAPAYAVPIVVPLGGYWGFFCRAYYKPSLKPDLFQFRRNHELRQFLIVGNAKQVRFATNLTVLPVRLPLSGKFVDRGLIPLTAACALETCIHKG